MVEESEAAGLIASECLCFRVRRVSRAITRIYNEALRPLDIQATQLTLLSAITLMSRQEEGGGRMGRLAEVLSMDRTTVSRNVRLLQDEGLVRIERSPRDGRVRIVLPTKAGERALAEGLPLWKQAHGKVVQMLGPDAAADFREQLDAVARAAASAEQEPS
jgi:DNA-binding MarR family transcriptional regulator